MISKNISIAFFLKVDFYNLIFNSKLQINNDKTNPILYDTLLDINLNNLNINELKSTTYNYLKFLSNFYGLSPQQMNKLKTSNDFSDYLDITPYSNKIPFSPKEIEYLSRIKRNDNSFWQNIDVTANVLSSTIGLIDNFPAKVFSISMDLLSFVTSTKAENEINQNHIKEKLRILALNEFNTNLFLSKLNDNNILNTFKVHSNEKTYNNIVEYNNNLSNSFHLEPNKYSYLNNLSADKFETDFVQNKELIVEMYSKLLEDYHNEINSNDENKSEKLLLVQNYFNILKAINPSNVVFQAALNGLNQAASVYIAGGAISGLGWVAIGLGVFSTFMNSGSDDSIVYISKMLNFIIKQLEHVSKQLVGISESILHLEEKLNEIYIISRDIKSFNEFSNSILKEMIKEIHDDFISISSNTDNDEYLNNPNLDLYTLVNNTKRSSILNNSINIDLIEKNITIVKSFCINMCNNPQFTNYKNYFLNGNELVSRFYNLLDYNNRQFIYYNIGIVDQIYSYPILYSNRNMLNNFVELEKGLNIIMYYSNYYSNKRKYYDKYILDIKNLITKQNKLLYTFSNSSGILNKVQYYENIIDKYIDEIAVVITRCYKEAKYVNEQFGDYVNYKGLRRKYIQNAHRTLFPKGIPFHIQGLGNIYNQNVKHKVIRVSNIYVSKSEDIHDGSKSTFVIIHKNKTHIYNINNGTSWSPYGVLTNILADCMEFDSILEYELIGINGKIDGIYDPNKTEYKINQEVYQNVIKIKFTKGILKDYSITCKFKIFSSKEKSTDTNLDNNEFVIWDPKTKKFIGSRKPLKYFTYQGLEFDEEYLNDSIIEFLKNKNISLEIPNNLDFISLLEFYLDLNLQYHRIDLANKIIEYLEQDINSELKKSVNGLSFAVYYLTILNNTFINKSYFSKKCYSLLNSITLSNVIKGIILDSYEDNNSIYLNEFTTSYNFIDLYWENYDFTNQPLDVGIFIDFVIFRLKLFIKDNINMIKSQVLKNNEDSFNYDLFLMMNRIRLFENIHKI